MNMNEFLQPTIQKMVLFGSFLILLALSHAQLLGIAPFLSAPLFMITFWLQPFPFFIYVIMILQIGYFYLAAASIVYIIKRFPHVDLSIVTLLWATPFFLSPVVKNSFNLEFVLYYFSNLLGFLFYGFLLGGITLWINKKLQNKFTSIPKWGRIIGIMVGLTIILAIIILLYFITATSFSNHYLMD